MQQPSSAIPSGSVTDSDVEHRLSEHFILSRAFPIFISHHTEYYKERFLRLVPIMEKQISHMQRIAMVAGGFNLSAAFFTCWWMAYRRMYLTATIFMIFEFGVMVLLGRYFHYVTWLLIVTNVVIGCIGNSMYYDHCNNQLAKCHFYEDYVRKGGTSPLSCFAFLGLSAFVCLMAEFVRLG